MASHATRTLKASAGEEAYESEQDSALNSSGGIVMEPLKQPGQHLGSAYAANPTSIEMHLNRQYNIPGEVSPMSQAVRQQPQLETPLA